MKTIGLPLLRVRLASLLCLLLWSSPNLLAQNWVNGGNSLSANGRFGTNTNYSVIFETNNNERGRITNGGNWGIGTSSPSGRFHVNSAAGANAFRASVGGSTKLLVHSAGGVSIGSSSAPPANGLFVSGNAGIGATPGSYKVKIAHGTFGFNIENVSSLDDWEFWSNSGGLSLYANDFFRGNFNPNTGAYSAVSDKRLKTNIKAMPSVLEKVSQLKPATYQFKDATTAETKTSEESSTPESYGFLAQEVKDIFPNLVTHHVDKERNLDTYTMDYSGFGVIAIKAIQELQQTLQAQQQVIVLQKLEIEALQERFAELEAALDLTGNSNGTNTGGIKGMDGVSLEQNFPNPFNQITTFRYKIPTGANAQILIYDVSSGNLIKTIPAAASGQAQLNAYDLKPGIYSYTLLVNGQVAASKKMVVEK